MRQTSWSLQRTEAVTARPGTRTAWERRQEPAGRRMAVPPDVPPLPVDTALVWTTWTPWKSASQTALSASDQWVSWRKMIVPFWSQERRCARLPLAACVVVSRRDRRFQETTAGRAPWARGRGASARSGMTRRSAQVGRGGGRPWRAVKSAAADRQAATMPRAARKGRRFRLRASQERSRPAGRGSDGRGDPSASWRAA